MADQGSIANLKQNINENIYDNTDYDISGGRMNTVLQNIVDTLEFNGRDFFNVNEYREKSEAYADAAAGRAAVPDEVKKIGLVITYLLADGWYIDQFIGSNISGWGTASNWKVFGPVSVTQNIMSIGNIPAISINAVGITKTAATLSELESIMDVGDIGWAANAPVGLRYKKDASTLQSMLLTKGATYIIKGTKFIFNGTTLQPHLDYLNGVVSIFAIQNYRPSSLQDGQFYIHSGNMTLNTVIENTPLAIPLTTNGLYRLPNNDYYWYNGTSIVKIDITNAARLSQRLHIVQYIDTIYSSEINDKEYYLNSTSGKLYQRVSGTNVEQSLSDGDIAICQGVALMYNALSGKWIPQLSQSLSVPVSTGKDFAWKAVSSGTKIVGTVSDNIAWGCAIRQRINKGDVVIVSGTGSSTSPLLAITDSNYNILYKIETQAGEKAPCVMISQYNGYVFHNYLGSAEHSFYLSSVVKEINIIGIFGSNPAIYYNYPFNTNDIYYNSDNRFLLKTLYDPVDITSWIKSLASEVVIRCNQRKYNYDGKYMYDADNKVKVYNLDPLGLHALSPENIATMKEGVTFDYTTYLEELYAKFDGLVSTYPTIVSKIDAVTLTDLTYPLYCRLEGEAQGGYYATPSYDVNLYKIVVPSTSSLNQGTYNRPRKVLIVSGVHPYEIAAPINVYLVFRNLLEHINDLGKDIFQIFANTEFYIIPCLNGYGVYNYSRGFSRINANGVNINRNFPTIRWVQGSAGQNYGGDTPGSEFETQLVMQVTKAINPTICIDAHNFDKTARQFFTAFSIGNVALEQLLYNFYVDISRKLKSAYPAYFGASFGFITNTTQTVIEDVGASTSEWWGLTEQIQWALTFEISRCINYENGVFVPETKIDDYGNTLYSCNELGLRTILYMLLNEL